MTAAWVNLFVARKETICSPEKETERLTKERWNHFNERKVSSQGGGLMHFPTQLCGDSRRKQHVK